MCVFCFTIGAEACQVKEEEEREKEEETQRKEEKEKGELF